MRFVTATGVMISPLRAAWPDEPSRCRFPRGARYYGRLRWALQRLGLAMKNPFEDGSDNAAVFVAIGPRTLAAGAR